MGTEREIETEDETPNAERGSTKRQGITGQEHPINQTRSDLELYVSLFVVGGAPKVHMYVNCNLWMPP